MGKFLDREAGIGEKRGLEERLKEYPELRKKFEMLIEVVENDAGDIEKAAEAERRVTEELRQIGNEVLNVWGRKQSVRKENETANVPGMQRKLKKTSTGRRDTGSGHSANRRKSSAADVPNPWSVRLWILVPTQPVRGFQKS